MLTVKTIDNNKANDAIVFMRHTQQRLICTRLQSNHNLNQPSIIKTAFNFAIIVYLSVRAVARTLTGGRGVYIHISGSARLVSFEIKLISKDISRAEPEYMNIHPPSISVLATALLSVYINTCHIMKQVMIISSWPLYIVTTLYMNI